MGKCYQRAVIEGGGVDDRTPPFLLRNGIDNANIPVSHIQHLVFDNEIY